jgi:hypothetical protein
MSYTKRNQPENHWRALVAQSIQDPETITPGTAELNDWLEIDYYGNIDRHPHLEQSLPRNL